MTSEPATATGRGAASLRPRVTDAIVEAVYGELAAKGFLGMSMEGVARRAGVGKSALYRRWPSKVEMTASVLRDLSVTDLPVSDTGTLEGDVQSLLRDIHGWLGSSRVRRIYPDLLAEAQRNPVLAEALMEHIGKPRRLRARQVLDRAAARGEVSPHADRDLILDVCGALIYWRLIALSRPVTPTYLRKVAALVLHLVREPVHRSA